MDPRIGDLRAAVATNDLKEAERLFMLVKDAIEADPHGHADILQYLSKFNNSIASASAKSIIIQKDPLIQHPEWGTRGIPLIASTNIKMLLNPSKTVEDLNKVLAKGQPTNYTEALDRYKGLLENSPLHQTDDSVQRMLDLCVAITAHSTPTQMARNMPELSDVFNWGMLYLHCKAVPYVDFRALDAAYQKCFKSPEDRAFVFRY